jgi:hypothetical protein
MKFGVVAGVEECGVRSSEKSACKCHRESQQQTKPDGGTVEFPNFIKSNELQFRAGEPGSMPGDDVSP